VTIETKKERRTVAIERDGLVIVAYSERTAEIVATLLRLMKVRR